MVDNEIILKTDTKIKVKTKTKTKSKNKHSNFVQHGIASHMGHSLHGRKQASGERHNKNELICAHKTLPFGTRIRVTNLKSGQSVIVRVTDRGPFGPGRIVDLSLAAARKIHIDKSGVAKVKQQSINVPVNLRYAVGLGSMANMFFFAGPQWGFNIGHKNYGTESYSGNENRNFLSFKDSNFSINVGLGATLLKHLQVSANYNIACGKTADISYGKALESIAKARSRSNCWQIALGYWF